VEKLSGSRSVIRPNYIEPVAGRNSTSALAIKDLADEVVAAVRAESKQRCDLVGGSLGAAVATCVAAEYPEMVRSLVLISGFSKGSDPRTPARKVAAGKSAAKKTAPVPAQPGTETATQ
jgi:pimeloyl-ACP methyl ester carboxylesterase